MAVLLVAFFVFDPSVKIVYNLDIFLLFSGIYLDMLRRVFIFMILAEA